MASQALLVIGGSGPTGRLIVKQALDSGRAVTAMARHPENVGFTHARLTLVTADATDPDATSRAVAGHDVVISVLGRGLGLRSGGLLTRATPGIIAAMEARAVRRFVLVSALGVGGTAPEAPLISRIIFRSMLRDIYADKAVAEALVRDTALDWTILAPTRLVDSPGIGRYRLAESAPPEGPWTIARADLAIAVLDSIDDPRTIRRRLVVAA